MMARLSGGQVLTGVAVLLAAALAASAQPAEQSSSMQGIQMNRDQPVKIESSTLEVRDKIRQATFSGDVKLVQGDTTLKCRVLVVFYEDGAMSPGKKSAPQAQKGGGGPGGGQQQIKRAEAKGDVFVTQKDQTASGDSGIYDLKSNTITMIGNVVLTQGQSVLRGERMVVDLTTGVTRIESTKGGPPVQMLTQPGAKDAKAAPAPAPPPAKAAPKGPIRIN